MNEALVVGPENGPLHRLSRGFPPSGTRFNTLLDADAAGLVDVLSGGRFQVLLLDGRLPLAQQRALLKEAGGLRPEVIRLLVSECAQDPDAVASGAHQVLPMREDMSYLGAVVDSACGVSRRLAGNERVARLVSELDRLPSSPMLYFDLRDELSSEQGNVDRLGAITSRDPALVAEVLRMANSAFYGLPRSVRDLSDAIRLLGTDVLLSLVLAAHLFSGMPPPGVRIELLWEHSVQVSGLARRIAAMAGASRNEQGVAAIAGMLHDVGLLVLLENDPLRYLPLWRESAGSERQLAVVEQATYGLTHSELGALVLNLWTLPEDIVSAVEGSHRPDVPPESPIARSVVAAEWLVGDGLMEEADQEPAPAWMVEHLPAWRAAWKAQQT